MKHRSGEMLDGFLLKHSERECPVRLIQYGGALA